MKWFIVMTFLFNGQPHMIIDDRAGFDTPNQCEMVKNTRQASVNTVKSGVPLKLVCAGNHVVGNFEFLGQ